MIYPKLTFLTIAFLALFPFGIDAQECSVNSLNSSQNSAGAAIAEQFALRGKWMMFTKGDV